VRKSCCCLIDLSEEDGHVSHSQIHPLGGQPVPTFERTAGRRDGREASVTGVKRSSGKQNSGMRCCQDKGQRGATHVNGSEENKVTADV
jgi:hypothetical protein